MWGNYMRRLGLGKGNIHKKAAEWDHGITITDTYGQSDDEPDAGTHNPYPCTYHTNTDTHYNYTSNRFRQGYCRCWMWISTPCW